MEFASCRGSVGINRAWLARFLCSSSDRQRVETHPSPEFERCQCAATKHDAKRPAFGCRAEQRAFRPAHASNTCLYGKYFNCTLAYGILTRRCGILFPRHDCAAEEEPFEAASLASGSWSIAIPIQPESLTSRASCRRKGVLQRGTRSLHREPARQSFVHRKPKVLWRKFRREGID